MLLLASAPAWSEERTGVMGTNEDRLFWLIPNYKTVDEQRSQPVITSRDKFSIAINDSFDPYAFPTAAFFAGISQLQNNYPSWGHGADGFGRRFLAAFADQTVSNVMSEAVFPIVLHQDPRFLRLGRGSVFDRVAYAATRICVTRGDDGSAEFNVSEFGGNAVMAVASNLYAPPEDRGVSDTAIKWGIQLGVDMMGSIFREFWPDIKRILTGKAEQAEPGRERNDA
ncbi:MAG TPA: hypothetical protein VMW17_11910 [Candidatus Binatia bacterium]|nr:hypothetical protein [Candidatus Binatia bacterium]